MNEYVRGVYRMVAIFAAGVVLSLLPFLDRKRAAYWQAAVYVAACALLGALIYGYWRWTASRFDH